MCVYLPRDDLSIKKTDPIMARRFGHFLKYTFAILFCVAALSCGDAPEAHEHGPETHTHDAPEADTAGTYPDTTSLELEQE